MGGVGSSGERVRLRPPGYHLLDVGDGVHVAVCAPAWIGRRPADARHQRDRDAGHIPWRARHSDLPRVPLVRQLAAESASRLSLNGGSPWRACGVSAPTQCLLAAPTRMTGWRSRSRCRWPRTRRVTLIVAPWFLA